MNRVKLRSKETNEGKERMVKSQRLKVWEIASRCLNSTLMLPIQCLWFTYLLISSGNLPHFKISCINENWSKTPPICIERISITFFYTHNTYTVENNLPLVCASIWNVGFLVEKSIALFVLRDCIMRKLRRETWTYGRMFDWNGHVIFTCQILRCIVIGEKLNQCKRLRLLWLHRDWNITFDAFEDISNILSSNIKTWTNKTYNSHQPNAEYVQQFSFLGNLVKVLL